MRSTFPSLLSAARSHDNCNNYTQGTCTIKLTAANTSAAGIARVDNPPFAALKLPPSPITHLLQIVCSVPDAICLQYRRLRCSLSRNASCTSPQGLQTHHCKPLVRFTQSDGDVGCKTVLTLSSLRNSAISAVTWVAKLGFLTSS